MGSYEDIVKLMKQDIIRSNDKRKVIIVEGAPGSGKSTFVSKEKQKGDLVLDLDMIVSALQGDNQAHPDYDAMLDIALEVREVIYNAVEQRKGKWNAAYIITSNPSRSVVESLKERLNAKIVSMNISEEECIKRINNDSSRENKDKHIELAHRWYKERT